MKNLILLFIVTLLVCNCSICKSQTASESHQTVEDGTIGLGEIPDSVLVPLDEAYKMVANYAPRAGFVPEFGKNELPNTRAVWFDLDRMEALIHKLRQEKADGIRIYFGAYSAKYPDSTSETNLPPKEVWGYNTVLLVSTKDSIQNGQHYHWDYYTDLKRVYPVKAGGIVAASVENRAFLCPVNCVGAELLQPREP